MGQPYVSWDNGKSWHQIQADSLRASVAEPMKSYCGQALPASYDVRVEAPRIANPFGGDFFSTACRDCAREKQVAITAREQAAFEDVQKMVAERGRSRAEVPSVSTKAGATPGVPTEREGKNASKAPRKRTKRVSKRPVKSSSR